MFTDTVHKGQQIWEYFTGEFRQFKHWYPFIRSVTCEVSQPCWIKQGTPAKFLSCGKGLRVYCPRFKVHDDYREWVETFSSQNAPRDAVEQFACFLSQCVHLTVCTLYTISLRFIKDGDVFCFKVYYSSELWNIFLGTCESPYFIINHELQNWSPCWRLIVLQ